MSNPPIITGESAVITEDADEAPLPRPVTTKPALVGGGPVDCSSRPRRPCSPGPPSAAAAAAGFVCPLKLFNGETHTERNIY